MPRIGRLIFRLGWVHPGRRLIEQQKFRRADERRDLDGCLVP
jgi:hypothetical protein